MPLPRFGGQSHALLVSTVRIIQLSVLARDQALSAILAPLYRSTHSSSSKTCTAIP